MLFYQSMSVGFIALGMCLPVLSKGNIPVSRSGVFWAFAAGAINALGIFTFSKALGYGKVGVTSAIVSCSPLLTALVAWTLFGEALAPKQILGMLLCIIGLALIVMK